MRRLILCLFCLAPVAGNAGLISYQFEGEEADVTRCNDERGLDCEVVGTAQVTGFLIFDVSESLLQSGGEILLSLTGGLKDWGFDFGYSDWVLESPNSSIDPGSGFGFIDPSFSFFRIAPSGEVIDTRLHFEGEVRNGPYLRLEVSDAGGWEFGGDGTGPQQDFGGGAGSFSGPVSVPEPATLGMLGAGLFALVTMRRKRLPSSPMRG